MTAVTPPAAPSEMAAGARQAEDRGLLAEIGAAIRRDYLAVAGLTFLTILVFVAIFGASLAPYDPGEIIRGTDGKVAVLRPPSSEFPLGTTALGRDVFSQMLVGARPVVIVGFVCALIPTIFGYILGLMAGYLRGGFDSFISRLVEVAHAIPADPFAIVLLSVMSPTLGTLILAISLTYWKRPTRTVRNLVLTLNESAFVKASRIAGARSAWIMLRHMAPLTLPLAFVYVPIGFANAVLAEASLSFLGFGDPTLISWGGIMRDAFNGGALSSGWWWVVPPGIAITVTAASMYLVTRPLEEVIDPRLRSGGAR